MGSDQATTYQQTASSVLSELLSTVSEKKSVLEQAVLVLTGDAQAEPADKTELALPDKTGEDVLGDEANDFEPGVGRRRHHLLLVVNHVFQPQNPVSSTRLFQKQRLLP